LCTFVSFVVDELQMQELQRTERYTKEVIKACNVLARGNPRTYAEFHDN
jgi:hypothetical protein